MDFFGIGPLELLLILVIFMVVVGPEKIPDLARRQGSADRAFRGATTQFTEQIDREVRSIQEGGDSGTGQQPRQGSEDDSSRSAGRR